MLRIKYFDEFKGDHPLLVITSSKDGFAAAHNFFKDKQGASLNDSAVTEFSDIKPLDGDNLYLNAQECQHIAEHFGVLSKATHPCHVYLDTDALGDHAEMMISYNEYDGLF